ncbi:NAD(P)H-hydrate dehydratase [Luteimonas deserti]|uniref:ADP-dependent (S)-NAD(P)H-hydrate dehydratase n=1 Tax=Luteimonas deserti TaxID=2752306 RepID=A0A7Z0TUN7_9GAMM|nr:NAD(P)H-hydrate dehydratase [Luteimonas deserti]NYZ63051.1 NAD(P)H-hydrate dehydratase [Luteimonas deserti]
MSTRPRARADAAGRRIDAALLKRWPLPDPSTSDSKEDRGRVLVIGGSAQVPGAVLLAGTGALRAGAGKLQIATAARAALPLAIVMPEAKVIGLADEPGGAIRSLGKDGLRAVRGAGAVLVGPGMDAGPATRRLVAAVIAEARGIVVLDAGALDATTGRALARRPSEATIVMTPHAGEMAAMLGSDAATVTAEAAALARNCARDWGVVLALKGRVTHIAAPDGRLWINTAGSVGLGTSGSGDVLAGVVAGLAARGSSAEQAAVWGVHLHAKAGARLSRRQGLVGFLAREISAEIPGLMP